MLAQYFLAADALGITEAEHDALVRVLGMLERNELPHVQNVHERSGFNMAFSRVEEACGTVGCIAGWANAVSGGHAFPWAHSAGSFFEQPISLYRLFLASGACRPIIKITPSEAAFALRNYLTLGEPRWNEVLN